MLSVMKYTDKSTLDICVVSNPNLLIPHKSRPSKNIRFVGKNSIDIHQAIAQNASWEWVSSL